MASFFYRIDYLNLLLGQKASGFVFSVDAPYLARFQCMQLSEAERTALVSLANKKIQRANLFSGAVDCSISYWESSCCPRVFSVGGVHGGSLGADPEVFATLQAAADRYPGGIGYTPHNIDMPAAALSLVILAQTWAEYVDARLAHE